MAHEHQHNPDHGSESTHIRAEIRETRDRMSGTLDQLGTRLNPNRIKAQVRENIREATVGRVENMARHASERVNETREGIMDTIRDNPIPAAMIGIGLGWLLFNGRRQGSHSHVHDLMPGELRGSSGSGVGYYGDVSATTPRLAQDDAAGGIGASISHWDEPGIADRVRSRVANVGDSASGAVDDARERISEVAGSAQERVSEVSNRVRDVASDVAQTTRFQAHRIEDRLSRTMHDNPLALGAVALAVGVAAGMAIPETRREHELMGGARDQLMDRARNVAEDAREKVQNVAERVIDETRDTAREAARDEGLTS
ncbi:MAG TPA: DUF3618 domain-containing protein [Longimicrobiales bacterium]